MAQRGLCSLCSQILETCVGIKKQNIGASNENSLKADVYIIYNYDSCNDSCLDGHDSLWFDKSSGRQVITSDSDRRDTI